MRPELARERVLLKRHVLLRIHAIARKKIVCKRGCVWLTQEGDRRDFVLCTGATFAFDRAGIALAWATGGDAMLALDEGLRAEHVQNDAPSRVAAAATLHDAIDAIVPRYDTRELATMPAGMRNAIVQREARRLRAQVVHTGRDRAQPHGRVQRCQPGGQRAIDVGPAVTLRLQMHVRQEHGHAFRVDDDRVFVEGLGPAGFLHGYPVLPGGVAHSAGARIGAAWQATERVRVNGRRSGTSRPHTSIA